MNRSNIALVSLALLAACSGNDVRNTLGLGMNTPDEFMVMTHPPLQQPEDYTALPVPGDVPADIASSRITDKAAQTLFRKESSGNASVSKGEAALLGKISTEPDPDIRRKIYAERQEAVQNRLEREDSTLGSLAPWTHDAKDPVLDAKAEAERIKKIQEDGEALSGDGVKEKDRKPKAPLEGIFN